MSWRRPWESGYDASALACARRSSRAHPVSLSVTGFDRWRDGNERRTKLRGGVSSLPPLYAITSSLSSLVRRVGVKQSSLVRSSSKSDRRCNVPRRRIFLRSYAEPCHLRLLCRHGKLSPQNDLRRAFRAASSSDSAWDDSQRRSEVALAQGRMCPRLASATTWHLYVFVRGLRINGHDSNPDRLGAW